MNSERPTTVSPCPLCTGTKISFYAFRKGHNLFRCTSCRLIFVYPMPESVEGVYSADYFTGAENGFGYTDYEHEKSVMIPTFAKYLEKVTANSPAPGKLLDVGAATGYFVELAANAGYDAEGVELSKYAAGVAQKKGLRVKQGKLEDAGYAPESFDVITMLDVFEHVTDPITLIEAAKKLLKPGGIIAINTVDADSVTARLFGKRWHLIVPPEHLLYFSVRNFSDFLKRHGFTPLEVAKVGKSFPFPYVLSTFARWVEVPFLAKLATRSQSTFLKHVRLPIHMRDMFLIIAKKDDVSHS